MARQRNPNSGFTMMEVMLTLAVVSILLMLTVQSAPKNNGHTVDREVDNIAFFFQVAQTNALNTKQAHVVEFDRTKHRIMIKSGYGEALETYTLSTCRILQGGLSGFLYKSNGDTNAFGTVRFDCMGEPVSFVFQIQKGRFRIER
ncbi:prepilin-type N-terminal cleavage/methylation domain-containing protein [Salinicoccus sediminis]|nr:prepilin-type N-terminal cleavage/methylation domain-containing protein [Salinicoccus sediminis]